mgnify:CR=1 FL=1
MNYKEISLQEKLDKLNFELSETRSEIKIIKQSLTIAETKLINLKIEHEKLEIELIKIKSNK